MKTDRIKKLKQAVQEKITHDKDKKVVKFYKIPASMQKYQMQIDTLSIIKQHIETKHKVRIGLEMMINIISEKAFFPERDFRGIQAEIIELYRLAMKDKEKFLEEMGLRPKLF